MNPDPALPNFFLVGAPKAGTTSLYHYLDQHPQIYMSPLKEPHFFSEEFRLANFSAGMRALAAPKLAALRRYLDGPMRDKHFGGPVETWEDYRRLFRGANGHIAAGEASVSYLWSPSAPRNIAACVPHAKIAAILRDPAERAFSQYLNLRALAAGADSFAEHIAAGLCAQPGPIGLLHPFLELGRYAEQIERYRAHFPPEQIRVYFYEDFLADPLTLVQDLFAFLAVDLTFVPDLSERHLARRLPKYPRLNRVLQRSGLWNLARGAVPPQVRKAGARVLFRKPAVALEPRDRALLADYYRDDILMLERLTGRDLAAWREPQAL